jgi:hypothetical protein
MSDQRTPQPPAPKQAEKVDDQRVTVLNADPYLRTIDFGENPADGTRRGVSIPASKTDKFHRVTPGRAEMPLSDWQAIKAHPTAKHLVRRGVLTLLAAEG